MENKEEISHAENPGRSEIADFIVARLKKEFDALKAAYDGSAERIAYFYIDDLLPEQLALRIFSSFPATGKMRLKKTIREFKYIAAQMDHYDPVLEETVYAFQDRRVVELVSRICGIGSLIPDEHLYAGGISLMGAGHFLNPHLDNSHDKDRNLWRVLNLLYYVTPEWPVESGGNLELWPHGTDSPQITLQSRFNRLIVMATHNGSWHSVSPVLTDVNPRCCVSNYYFSPTPLKQTDDFHVTSFRGRPDQPVRDTVLKLDARLRMLVRRVFQNGLFEIKHVYRK